MPAASILILLLLCAGILAGLSIALPPVLHALGLFLYRNSVSEDATALEPGADPLYAGVYRQLTELGLRPLGTCREVIWFFHYRWRWTVLLGVFGSRVRGCFACVYRFSPNEPVRVAFATCFDDGAHAWTANHMPELRISEDDHVRWAVETQDMAVLLAEHEQMLKIFAAKGRRPEEHDRLAVLAANLAVQTPRSVRRHTEKCAWLVLGWLLLFPGLLALLSLRPWILPAGMLVMSALWHLMHWLGRGEQAADRRHRVALLGIARHTAQINPIEPEPQLEDLPLNREAVRKGLPRRPPPRAASEWHVVEASRRADPGGA
jgi:hypothetical protein